MQLSDDAKVLIENEVRLLTQKQSTSLGNLNDDAQKLTKELETLIKDYRKTLNELNVYRWVVRFLLAALGIGTIWALWGVPEYVDKKISDRITKTDRLAVAVGLANSSRWRDSLGVLVEQWDDFKTPGFKPTDTFKKFLFSYLLFVLGQVESTEADGSWVGQELWTRLNNDPDYQRFKAAGEWDRDMDTNNGLGFCTLKFDKSDTALRTARKYFETARDLANPLQRRAPNLFALAMIDLIERKPELAEKKLREAEQLDPNNYKIADMIPYKNTFINSTEFKIWEQIARRFKAGEFLSLYNDFLNGLLGEKTNGKARKFGAKGGA
jgi:tetratricopeptide (TPR) repeat protein